MFGVHVEDLPAGETQRSLGATIRTRVLEGTIRFGSSRSRFEERIPFRVPDEPGADLAFCIIGREPFFTRHRTDFRMGGEGQRRHGRFTVWSDRRAVG